MTGWNEAYPYAIADDEWIGPFDYRWQDITQWCDTNLPEEWDYFNGEYRFKTAQAKAWFLLRWS